jgi:hypothetical protein
MGGVRGCPLVTNAGCSISHTWSIRDIKLNAGVYYDSCIAAQQLMEINGRLFSTEALSLTRRY